MSTTHSEKLVTLLVPYYKSSKTIDKCLTSLTNQTYKSIEIIVVDDGSDEDLSTLKAKYPQVKFVQHEKNKGLFHARITGVKSGTGDYFAFIDSDDELTVDWVRAAVVKAEKENADIVIGGLLLNYADRMTYFPASELWQCDINLQGGEVQDKFFGQQGLDFSWHILCGKLYTRALLEKSYVWLESIKEHIVMCEDVLQSSVIWTNAHKVVNIHDNYYLYDKSSQTNTSATGSVEQTEQKINELIKVFDLLEEYFRSLNHFQYLKDARIWRNRYIAMWENVVKKNHPNNRRLLNLCDISYIKTEKYKFPPSDNDFFYKEQAIYELPFEDIKRKIIEAKVVSFDVFDTLVTRPFLKPADLFAFLDCKLRDSLNLVDAEAFSKLRVRAELIAREIAWKQYKRNEVTLQDIYDVLINKYHFDRKVAHDISELECSTEISLAQPRNSIIELLNLAQYLGKKVLCISDMYLPEDTVKSILSRCGVVNCDLKVSSQNMKTKSSGEAFENTYGFKPNDCLHLGDNKSADYDVPLSKGWQAAHIPRTVDVFLGKYPALYQSRFLNSFLNDSLGMIENKAVMDFLGIRTMLAVVANTMFDNPWRHKYDATNFGYSSTFIGYFPFGFYIFALVSWVIRNTKNFENITFVARDGWVVYKVFDTLLRNTPDKPKTHYFPVSRQALLPLYYTNATDLLCLLNSVPNICNKSFDEALTLLAPNILNDLKQSIYIEAEAQGIEPSSELNSETKRELAASIFAKYLLNTFPYGKEKSFKHYLESFFKGKCATFDVGYSGRMEGLLRKKFGFDVTAFYVHSNSDIGFKRLNDNQRLRTFYGFSPIIKGSVREWLMSECTPSCTGYKEFDNKIIPTFKTDTNLSYSARISTEIAQKAAVDFSRKMIDIFSNDLGKLYFRKIDPALFFEYFLLYADSDDKYFLSSVQFEDQFGGYKNSFGLNHFWNQLQSLQAMNSNAENSDTTNSKSTIPYFLKGKGFKATLKKAVYWWLFDSKVIKQKLKKYIQRKMNN